MSGAVARAGHPCSRCVRSYRICTLLPALLPTCCTHDAPHVRAVPDPQVLQHQTLVMEVIQQLQRMFKPDLKLIKKRIEDLIQREYLERDKDNPTLFKYLA